MHNKHSQNYNSVSKRYVGRFAPTPSGALHFGSLVAALGSFLDARAQQGQWLLRIEDVDRARTRPEHIANIQRTLAAYQLHWDGEIRYQSKHLSDYESALQPLQPFLYPCACSRHQWQEQAHEGALGKVYPRLCLHQPPATTQQSALRLRLPDTIATFTDRRYGVCTYDLPHTIGDPVLRRKDGDIAYALAVTIDDALQGITDVVRGADLLAATVIQNQLQSLLHLPRPRYLHLPLVLDSNGHKLSKSHAAPALNEHAIVHSTRQALQFLGQAVPSEHCSQSALLQYAIDHWSPAQLPAV